MRLLKCFLVLFILLLTSCSKEINISLGDAHRFVDKKVMSAQFSNQGNLLLIIDFNSQAYVYNAQNYSELFKVTSDKKLENTKLGILSDDGTLLVLANDNYVAIWSLAGRVYIGKTQFLGVHDGASISSIAISKSNDKLLVGMSDGTINMATLSSRLNNRFNPHTRPVTHLKFINQNEYLSASQDGKLALRVFASTKPVFEQEYAHRVTTMVYDDKTDRLFVSDALSSQFVSTLSEPNSSVQLKYMARFMVFRQGYFIENDKILVTTSSKNHITFWDIESGEELGTWESLATSPNATILALHSNEYGELFTLNSDAMLEKWDLSKLNKL